jgi:hypothetical protein
MSQLCSRFDIRYHLCRYGADIRLVVLQRNMTWAVAVGHAAICSTRYIDQYIHFEDPVQD